MPYKSVSELPEGVRGLPARAKRLWMSAYNAAFKTYGGDEERAFKVAWSAVKKKFKKSGDKWVAKAQTQRTAVEAVRATRQLYEAYWQSGRGAKNRQPITDLLEQIETEPADHLEKLQQLEELGVPGFDLEQAHYGTYGGGSHEHDFPGSLDHRIRLVCRAIHEQGRDYLGPYGYVLAVYPTFAVTCTIDDCCGDETEYWRVEYQADDQGNITLGGAEEVDVLTVVIPAAAMGGDGEMESASQEGQPVSMGARPDATTSELKFDFTGALNEDPQWHTTPEWVTQGQPPPGGDEDLVQTLPLQVQEAQVDAATGVMKIRAVLTVGNVLNAMDEVYPTQVWQDNLPFLQAAAKEGSLIGESDHPAPGQSSLDRSCILWDEVWMEGDQVLGNGRILPTLPSGQNLQMLLNNKAKVDVSSRGRGTRKRGDWVNPSTGERYQNIYVVQMGFRCKTFDAVGQGASPGATITDHTMAQQTSEVNPTQSAVAEEIDMKELEALAQQVASLAAQVEKMGQQGTSPPAETPTPTVATQGGTAVLAPALDAQVQGIMNTEQFRQLAAATESLKHLGPMLIKQRRTELLDEAQVKYRLPQQWLNSYRNALDKANVQSVEELNSISNQFLPLIIEAWGKAPQFPSSGVQVQADAGERPGPKTPREVIDFLVRDLPDEAPPNAFLKQHRDDDGNLVSPDDWVKTPRRQCRKILQNIAEFIDHKHFDGQASLLGYWAMIQGYGHRRAQDWMDQACEDGCTTVAAGGAPMSAPFIFPLVRAVFPQLIAPEIASVQPMDRSDGRIFYLNALRIVTGMNVVDQAGETLTNRQFMNNSDSFSSSYADRAAECDEAVKIQLRLASTNVTATNKAVTTCSTIEELQDLRSYHGLDINSELMAYASREIALEWNLTILNEMAAGATAGTLTFGTTAPSGYTQKEWDEYLGRYVGAASNRIFRKRMGEATHLIAGPAAWEKLAAAFRVGTSGMSPNPEMFPGLVLTPFMSGAAMNIKCYKTAFWNGVNENLILLLRRGVDWSDTAYVWAPYIDYVSPILILPDTFEQQQGVMSRAAHRVVVGDAMSKIVISAGAGVPL